MLHEKHPLAQAISEFKLIDMAELDTFIENIKATAIGKTLVLTLQDELLVYTMMDITCKAYLTDLGDKLQSLNAGQLANSKSSFADIRNTVLKGCEIVMEGLRDELSAYPEFDDRIDILDNYVIV